MHPGALRRYRQEVDRRFLRPGWVAGHLLVFAAVLTCLRLGWWQWERTQEATGTAQNFGYALLWPGFGVAFIYMWVRFLHLEVLKDAEDDEQTDRELRELLSDGEPAEPAGEAGIPQPAADDGRDRLGSNGFAGSDGTTGTVEDGAREGAEDGSDDACGPTRWTRRRPDLQRPSQSVVVSVATVGNDDDDDPELTAYNQALAALAEEDRRRAR